MMEDRLKGCVQEFKTVSNRSMISFVFKDDSLLIRYQLEMLKNNRIPSLLNCEILKVDQETRISFDITSMLPLNKILERKEIGKRDFFHYLRQIAGVFDQLENHLLDYGGLLLDSSLIYGSPADDRIYFIYIPHVDMAQDINDSLRQFILDLIIREIKFKSEPSDNYIQRLIEILKAPDFDLKVLKTWLNASGHEGNAERTQPSEPQPIYTNGVPVQQVRPMPMTSHGTVQTKIPGDRNAGFKTVTEKKLVYPIKSWLTLGSSLIAFLALVAVMIMKGSFEPGNPDALTTLIGLALIGGAAIWLVCSKAFAPERKVEKVIEKKIRDPESKTFARPAGPNSQEQAAPKVVYVNKSIPQPSALVNPQDKVTAFREAACAADRTVVLAPKGNAGPFIKRVGGDGETVMIRQWPFRIGRMAEQVDYCVRNPAVGRIHAELTKGSQGYCITDMNTRNGTFINGIRIEPNMEHPLKNGDRIMLANEEFQFFE